MFKSSNQLTFYSTLILGSLITISSNSWIGCWMGLEINLLSFIPLMISPNNLLSTEATLKYFLTQALASTIFIFSILNVMMFFNLYFQFNNMFKLSIPFTLLALLIKSGAAPFHFWFPNVMEGLSWLNSFILMTWQKLAPLAIISYFYLTNLFFMIIISSTIISSLMGLNQTSLRKIMAFSSINHLGWLLSAMLFNETLWIFYFILYSILSLSIIYIFNTFKLFFMSQMFNIFYNSSIFKLLTLTSLLSLGGLPPFLGFFPKWLVIQSMIFSNNFLLSLILITTSLITLYFYLRITYTSFLLKYEEKNYPFMFHFNKINLIYMILIKNFSLFGLNIFIYLNFF